MMLLPLQVELFESIGAHLYECRPLMIRIELAELLDACGVVAVVWLEATAVDYCAKELTARLREHIGVEHDHSALGIRFHEAFHQLVAHGKQVVAHSWVDPCAEPDDICLQARASNGDVIR